MLKHNESERSHYENKRSEILTESNVDKLTLRNTDVNEQSDFSSKWNSNSGGDTTTSTEGSIEKSSNPRSTCVKRRKSIQSSQNFVRKTSKKVIKRKENSRNSLTNYYNVIKNISRNDKNENFANNFEHRDR